MIDNHRFETIATAGRTQISHRQGTALYLFRSQFSFPCLPGQCLYFLTDLRQRLLVCVLNYRYDQPFIQSHRYRNIDIFPDLDLVIDDTGINHGVIFQ